MLQFLHFFMQLFLQWADLNFKKDLLKNKRRNTLLIEVLKCENYSIIIFIFDYCFNR